MNTYHVQVPEVWYQTVEIQADSYEGAVQAVRDGDGLYLDDSLEYSATIEEWPEVDMMIELGLVRKAEKDLAS